MPSFEEKTQVLKNSATCQVFEIKQGIKWGNKRGNMTITHASDNDVININQNE